MANDIDTKHKVWRSQLS